MGTLKHFSLLHFIIKLLIVLPPEKISLPHHNNFRVGLTSIQCKLLSLWEQTLGSVKPPLFFRLDALPVEQGLGL